MHSARCLTALSFVALLSACGSYVANGGGESEEEATGGASTGEAPIGKPTPAPGPEPSGAGGAGGSLGPGVALTRAQNDVLWDEYWEAHGGPNGTSVGSGTPALDPDDLFIRISNLGASCHAISQIPCGGHWQVTLVLPPELQQVGVYDLESSAVALYSSMTETGYTDSDPGDCAAGGGSLGPGTVEVVAIDTSGLKIKLSTAAWWHADPSGEYWVPRCP